jgi:hypothetical protein
VWRRVRYTHIRKGGVRGGRDGEGEKGSGGEGRAGGEGEEWESEEKGEGEKGKGEGRLSQWVGNLTKHSDNRPVLGLLVMTPGQSKIVF